MRKVLAVLLACFFLSPSAQAFNGTATQMQMAPQIPPMDTCTQLSSDWTPQWASLKQYWRLEGTDSVPIANDTTMPATIGLSAVMKNANGTGAQYTYGVMGAGITMDTVDDGMVVAYDSSLDYSLITISAWIKLNALPPSDLFAVVSRLQTSGFGLVIRPNGSIQFQVYSDSAIRYATSASSTIDTGNWHHLVATYDGNNLVVYMDGVARATTPYAGVISYRINNALCIGVDAGSGTLSCTGGRRVNGAIDDVAIWDVGLTAGEVATLYKRTGCTN
ncbi:MAG: LamG domain-containing protein [Caldilinea sp.]